MPKLVVPVLLSLCFALIGCTKHESGSTEQKTVTPAAAPAASGASHTVALELTDPVSVGALQVDIDYGSTGGRFSGNADAVDCKSKVEGALSSFNNIVDQHLLKAAFVAVKGFTGPVRFLECKFEGAAEPSQFKVVVKDASSPELEDLAPPPAVKVVVE